MAIKAFLFDLNGTMIDDMQYHITAWHEILNKLGANLSIERVKEECYGKNNELLERIFPGRFSAEEKDAMSYAKEEAYQQTYKPLLKLIPGLGTFLATAHQQQIKMAIGSAAIMFNINFVLDNLSLHQYFPVIVSADDVEKSKPHPETYLKCAAALDVLPEECIVFEDALKGVESAANAGMKSVVLKTVHQQHEFAAYNNIIHFIDDYRQLDLKSIIA